MGSQDHLISMFESKIKSSLPYTLVIAIIGFVSLWVRTLPSDTVLLPGGIIKFTTNDAWYHMRTLYILLENYPHRMFFNPMTNYPYGSYIHLAHCSIR